jgi:acyl carrier protein
MMTGRDVQEVVASILEIQIADVGIDASFSEDLEMDSLSKMEFIVVLERALRAQFTPAEAAKLDSVRDVMRMLLDLRLVS